MVGGNESRAELFSATVKIQRILTTESLETFLQKGHALSLLSAQKKFY